MIKMHCVEHLCSFSLRSILSHAMRITVLRLMAFLSQGTLVVKFVELLSQKFFFFECFKSLRIYPVMLRTFLFRKHLEIRLFWVLKKKKSSKLTNLYIVVHYILAFTPKYKESFQAPNTKVLS